LNQDKPDRKTVRLNGPEQATIVYQVIFHSGSLPVLKKKDFLYHVIFCRSVLLFLPRQTGKTGRFPGGPARQRENQTNKNICIMILLTLYKEPEGRKEKKEFSLMHEAIEFGQKTGYYFDVFDPVSGRHTDWDEINAREEDEWYYDEKEYLWKKLKPEEVNYVEALSHKYHGGSFSQFNTFGVMALHH